MPQVNTFWPSPQPSRKADQITSYGTVGHRNGFQEFSHHFCHLLRSLECSHCALCKYNLPSLQWLYFFMHKALHFKQSLHIAEPLEEGWRILKAQGHIFPSFLKNTISPLERISILTYVMHKKPEQEPVMDGMRLMQQAWPPSVVWPHTTHPFISLLAFISSSLHSKWFLYCLSPNQESSPFCPRKPSIQGHCLWLGTQHAFLRPLQWWQQALHSWGCWWLCGGPSMSSDPLPWALSTPSASSPCWLGGGDTCKGQWVQTHIQASHPTQVLSLL